MSSSHRKNLCWNHKHHFHGKLDKQRTSGRHAHSKYPHLCTKTSKQQDRNQPRCGFITSPKVNPFRKHTPKQPEHALNRKTCENRSKWKCKEVTSPLDLLLSAVWKMQYVHPRLHSGNKQYAAASQAVPNGMSHSPRKDLKFECKRIFHHCSWSQSVAVLCLCRVHYLNMPAAWYLQDLVSFHWEFIHKKWDHNGIPPCVVLHRYNLDRIFKHSDICFPCEHVIVARHQYQVNQLSDDIKTRSSI